MNGRFLMTRRTGRLTLIAFSVVGACSEPDPPEQRLRDTIARAEEAVEAEDLGVLREIISEDYSDEYGYDAQRLLLLLRGYLLRHDAIHLLTRIDRLELAGDDFAELSIVVGMVGSPTDGWPVAGELYQIDAELRELGGEWRVVRARWRRAIGAGSR